MKGSPSLKFGEFEMEKAFNWQTMASVVGIAALNLANVQLIPKLSAVGGLWSVLTALVLVPVGKAVYLYLMDNTKDKT